MNDILKKKIALTTKIEICHANSFYSSLPNPQLIAVSKQQPFSKVKDALDAGHRVFGENKIQDALKRWTNFLNEYRNIELHFIGHLQTNKVKKALNFFDVIHTIDRESLATEVSKHFTSSVKTKKFMIQVNTGNELNKSGVSIKEFDDFYTFIKSLKIPISGLMCLPPINENPSIHFCMLREIANKYKINNLSMGMSMDFEQAIKFGSTHIRIGSAFFGQRI